MNIFIRTSIAQYRVDTYNVLHERYKFKMFFFYREDYEQHYSDDVVKDRLKFIPYYIEGPHIGHNGKFFTGLYKIMKNEKPKIVIVPEFKICSLQVLIYSLFLKNKPKVISMCDDSYNMVSGNNNFSFMHKIARKIILPLLDNIILADKQAVEWYQNNYHKGIWLPIIRKETVMEGKYKSILGLSNIINKKYNLQGKYVILYVGRLVAVKNISNLIHAVNKMRNDAALVIVGEGDERDYLEKIATTSNKKIIFTGKLLGDELYAWYNVSDIFSLLSTIEPFGAVINEALLAGNKCVVSSRVGAKCLIDSRNGLIVDPYNIVEICSALDKIVGDMPLTKSSDIVYKGNFMNVSFDERIEELGNIF